jgi:uncharacterized protein (TIRG00374 family)
VQAVVSIGLLVVLMRRLDLMAFAALLARVPVWFYVVSLAVVLGGQLAYAWRWRLLLVAAGAHVPYPTVVRQYFVGIFVNNFLPSTVGGDVAKVYYLGRDHGFGAVTASVAIDRLLGVGLLALLACVALVVSPVAAPTLTAALLASVAVAVIAVGLVAITTVGTGGLPRRVRPLGARAVMLATRLQRLRLDMAAPLARPAIVAKAALVVVGYAVAVSVVYVQFIALEQPPPPLQAIFAVVTATTVLSNIPISLNGLGLREQLHAALLAPLGVAPETAVAISLLLYGHLLIASGIGFVLWIRMPRFSPRTSETLGPTAARDPLGR